MANTSEKVASDFRYQAVTRIGRAWPSATRRCAMRHTSENRANNAGVVWVIAQSDHCRWVSTPRCRRVSSKVTSTFQRRTNRARIDSADRSKSVLNTASGGS